MKDKNTLRIVFFGTPEFAAFSLKKIHRQGYTVVAVVTSPDKQAGRGYKIQESAVKQAAMQLGLPVLQPTNLKSPEFLQALSQYKADIQIVIAFRMLPEVVWNMPEMGTFNLHASYLPFYRGAAPINRVLMNGEKETGITTFFLKHEIDTGNILLQEKVEITDSDNAGSLHDKLMIRGADLVCASLEAILKGNVELKAQAEGNYPHAPKLFTDDCKINWEETAIKIHNQIRGLSPYPAAFTEFRGKKMKVFSSEILTIHSSEPGKLEVSGKDRLLAHCKDFCLSLTDIQYEGKKRMPVRDFINGLHH